MPNATALKRGEIQSLWYENNSLFSCSLPLDLIFVTKVLHLASFWMLWFMELENGPFSNDSMMRSKKFKRSFGKEVWKYIV